MMHQMGLIYTLQRQRLNVPETIHLKSLYTIQLTSAN